MVSHTIKPTEKLYIKKDMLITQANLFSKKSYGIHQLTKLSIFTSDQGPFLDDVAMVMFFEGDIIVLPSEHKCYKMIYDELSKVVSFDYEAVIKAMSSTENAEFILWRK